MKKGKVNFIISLLIGIILFIITLRYFGLESIKIIYHNINPLYFIIYFIISCFVFIVSSWRVQSVLRAYRKKIGLWKLIKQNIAGFAVAYVTPCVRLGGEPIKAYMMKKESGVDLKTGSSVMILDKFIEIVGTILFGLLGLAVLFLMPNIPNEAKITLIGVTIVGSIILYWVYYRTIKKQGSFSTLFILLKIYKLTKSNNFLKSIEDVEAKMHKFFMFNKKEFLISLIFYMLYMVVNIIEFKFLFLSFGVNLSVSEIIITIVVLGIVNFIPTPAALGFFEASQSGLFSLLKDSAGVGLAFSLIVRLRNVFFTIIGFSIISHFSAEQIINKEDKTCSNRKLKNS
jgi:hypothetical protein